MRDPFIQSTSNGLEIKAPTIKDSDEILTPEALAFVAELAREFSGRRKSLIQNRIEHQAALDAGQKPDFLTETEQVRQREWTIASIPSDLQNRRVEITGPVDRKMIINGLNSGAKVFMADFEDATSPTWNNVISGQMNLRDAVNRSIDFTGPNKKRYALNQETATLIVRPRGWHLPEKHVLIDGLPISASLFDFGLYFFHNARTLLEKGSGPYFYLPKLENHLEARLWNDVFNMAQDMLNIPRGTIKATVLIETIPAAFEMDEILYELRDHCVGLNCGRWDYIFSCIKKFRSRPDFCFADRSLITMTTHFMRSYSLLAIKTCHRRGAHAIGGMAAQIPIKNDPQANEAALAKILEDKEREAADGHDGTWVAHPGLVSTAYRAFERVMPDANQIDKKREDVEVTAHDLLNFGPESPITNEGLRINISVGIQYLGSWLVGQGCVPIFNLMEDAATAEISRSQIWQWINNPKGILDDGEKVTTQLFRRILEEELNHIVTAAGSNQSQTKQYRQAAQLLDNLVSSKEFVEFLTLPAYDLI